MKWCSWYSSSGFVYLGCPGKGLVDEVFEYKNNVVLAAPQMSFRP